MKNTYFNLVDQTFYWPAFGFDLKDNNLTFYDIPLMEVIEQYGTPLKLFYMPKISQQIQKAKDLFRQAMEKYDYNGQYYYCYCTKSSHFRSVVEQVLKNDCHLETSSAYDLDIIQSLYKRQKITKDTFIVCNGFKMPRYTERISHLLEEGFNVIPILDNLEEVERYNNVQNRPIQLGLRIASEEEPNFEFYTSRLGIRYKDIVPFYQDRLADRDRYRVKMLHFFINTGIRDTSYYWSELNKCVSVYCDLKRICPDLDSFNIGGGLPVPNSLGFEYDYEYMISEIVRNIKRSCQEEGVPEPKNIFTEFGSYTCAEAGANISEVELEKLQNDAEKWYMIDSSLITTLPDTWGIDQRFTLLSVNNWDQPYQRVNIGGLTCDSQDYYSSEVHAHQVFLPTIPKDKSLYIGFFHTGAYQESLGGYGGIQHCLIPAPKQVVVDKDEEGNFTYELFAEEQTPESMMKILGY